MLPPGTIISDDKPFFFYDLIDANNNRSMNSLHYHNFFEIYYLLSGTCDYLISDRIYPISSNSLILIPPDVVHKTTYTSGHHKRIVLNFTKDFFHKYLLNELTEVKSCSIDEGHLPFLKSLFDAISKVTDYRNPKNEILINCYLNELAIFIMDHNKYDFSHINTPLPTPIEIAIRYISDNYNEQISLSTLAAQFNYSSDYFAKLFKKQTGDTFKKFLFVVKCFCDYNPMF